MNRRPLLVAFLSAALGTLLLHTYLARFELEAAGGKPRSIVIVTSDVGLGQVITRAHVAERDLPEAYLEERHVHAEDLERVVGARLTSPVASGSALLWSDLDLMQDGRTLSGLVRTGARAYAIAARDVTFDGLLRPGDRVDVLLIPHEGSLMPSVALENLLVLTVGRDLGVDAHESESRQDGQVSLSVTPEQSRVLARAETEGHLRLLLRNPQDLVTTSLTRAPVDSTQPAGASHVH